MLEDKEKSLQMFQDFLDDKVDIEPNSEALNILFDIVAKFGTEKDENDQDTFTPIAEKVVKKQKL